MGIKANAEVTGKKLFLVDDSKSIINIINVYLSYEGFQDVTTFDTPIDALESICTYKGEAIVISDFHMPCINGKELLDRVTQVNPSLRGILMSAAPLDALAGFHNYPVLDKNSDFFTMLLDVINKLDSD